MKNFVLLIIVLILTANLKAQVSMSSYKIGGVEKQVQIDAKSDGNYTLYIDMDSADKLHKTVGITVNPDTHKALLISLSKAKEKFSEWTTVAKDNNVTDLYKKMDFSVKVNSFFMYYDDWKFDYNNILNFHFMVFTSSNGETQYVLILSTDELSASDNEFMKMDGISTIFFSTESLNGFMESISLEKVNNFMNKPKKDELFK